MGRGAAVSPLKKGLAKVGLRDNTGRALEMTLIGALDVPSFPQDIFSSQQQSQGAMVIFKDGQNRLVPQKGVTIDIQVYNTLFY